MRFANILDDKDLIVDDTSSSEGNIEFRFAWKHRHPGVKTDPDNATLSEKEIDKLIDHLIRIRNRGVPVKVEVVVRAVN